MGYLLDTSTLAEVLRAAPQPGFVRRLSQVSPRDRWTSVITVSQLLVAARLERNPRLMQQVVRLVSSIRVAAYDLSAAQAFAKFRSTTATSQTTDEVMVAAIATARDFTLVTRRRQAFASFSGLRLEDWIG